MGCVVAALYFFRFWKDTGDRLFVLFGIAFAVLAIHRGALALSPHTAESEPYFYLARLGAFILIAFAVADKNRRG
jgi:hypothetical protein